MNAQQELPKDPQEVRTTAGRLFDTPGIYLATQAGNAFIPAHCLPDVQRRLATLARHFEKHALTRPRKDPAR
ncbi:hypothetical protein [Kocuria marina]|uniref:hypothetical protein n=1 Tax=Kocuria marina TaxID=223184 RepID=UPI0022E497F3|nr:hypothetical protein [Kocuria marina]